jgi:PAS domain S-box-containing protein
MMRPARLVTVMTLVAIVLPVVTLSGYLTGLPVLVRLVSGGAVMVPGTAVALLVSGIALWLLAPHSAPPARRRAGRVLSLVVALYGAGVLAEYLADRNLGLDAMLFAGEVQAWSSAGIPGRSSPHAAIALAGTGLALALLDADARRGYRPSRILIPAGGLVAGVALLGQAYGVVYVSGAATVNTMAYPTAACLVALSVGALAARPDRTAAQVILGGGPGGAVVRGLAPTVFATILLVGVMLTAIGRQDLPRQRAAVTTAAALLVLILYLAVLWAGTALNRAGRAIRDERDFNRALLHSLHDGLLTTGAGEAVLEVTPRWCEITGFDEQDVIGCTPPYPWWPTEHVADLSAMREQAVAASAVFERDMVIRRKDGTEVEVLVTVSPVADRAGSRTLVTTYRDLTERNQAEAERRRAAERLDLFFDISTDLLCIAGTDGYFKQVNPAWVQTLGYSAEELTSRPFVEFVHPDDVTGTRAETAEQLATGKVTISFENRYRCRDGSYKWLNWNAVPSLDDGLIYAVARDTTGRRQIDDTRAWLAAIVNGTEDDIIGKSVDGTITSWNPAAERQYGYPAAEAIGQSIRLILPPDDLEEMAVTRDRVAHGEPVQLHNTVRVRRNGTRLHMTVSISPVRDSAGNVTGAASIARDITDRLQAEERFQRLVLAAPDAMLIVDPSDTILLVNEQTERLFGYPGAELIGQPVDVLIPEHFHDEHLGYRRETHAASQVHRIGAGRELTGRRRDGSRFPVEISLAPLATEQGMQVTAAIRDITAQRQVERALADARDEALAAGRLKSQFVAMVSHEIRTPMNGVIGLTNLLLQAPLQPGPRRYAKAIRASGQALLTIINDILDVSKIEAGRIELIDVDFHLDELLQEVIQAAAETARDKALEVLAYYPPDLPTTLRADAGRLRQILLNLLGNAVKFTDSGEVLLCAQAAPDAPDGRPQFRFVVSDTGIGIAASDLSGLFDPFSQVDRGTNREFGGTGLGLTISHQLVELMGGRLDVQSTPGLGSQFSFTVPLAVGAAPVPRRSSDHLSGRRLLVVDDNATNRHLIIEHALAWGLSPTGAPDGSTALDLLRHASRDHPYDVAVIDQHMPGIDGTDLIRRITADPVIAPVAVVLLTSGSHQDDQIAAAIGVRAMLPKPVGPSPLYNCLLDVLDPDAALSTEQPPPRAEVAGGRGLILVAEDNATNQIVAVDTLTMLGYEVDVARNGLEALELADTKPYRAILMDCQMPKMDGYAATAALRHREKPDQHMPIIAMTAGALLEDRQRCIAAGMDDYLAKPIDPAQLRETLDRWTATEARTR